MTNEDLLIFGFWIFGNKDRLAEYFKYVPYLNYFCPLLSKRALDHVDLDPFLKELTWFQSFGIHLLRNFTGFLFNYQFVHYWRIYLRQRNTRFLFFKTHSLFTTGQSFIVPWLICAFKMVLTPLCSSAVRLPSHPFSFYHLVLRLFDTLSGAL